MCRREKAWGGKAVGRLTYMRIKLILIAYRSQRAPAVWVLLCYWGRWGRRRKPCKWTLEHQLTEGRNYHLPFPTSANPNWGHRIDGQLFFNAAHLAGIARTSTRPGRRRTSIDGHNPSFWDITRSTFSTGVTNFLPSFHKTPSLYTPRYPDHTQ